MADHFSILLWFIFVALAIAGLWWFYGRANRFSFGKVNLDGPFQQIDYQDSFSAEEYKKIKKGFVPKSMDDHWLIFFEKPFIYCVESWNRKCLYKVKIALEDGMWVVEQAFVLGNDDSVVKFGLDSPVETLRAVLRSNLGL